MHYSIPLVTANLTNMPTYNFASFMMVADSRAVTVLLWMLEYKAENNHLYTTLDSIAAECGVTKTTVNKLFQKLYALGFLVKIRNGQYMLHPEILPSRELQTPEELMLEWDNLKVKL